MKTCPAIPQEMCVQHWQLAAVIPIPSLLALWFGWREGKRFNTKAREREGGWLVPETTPKTVSNSGELGPGGVFFLNSS